MNLTTSMFSWQEEAVKKLLPIRIGALYMEMGLGKTRTALEMIKIRLDRGKIDAVLWLCPCSVRENLKQDILRHSTDALPKIAVYGIESLSSSIRIYELLARFVTSRRVMLIVDESNLVKNFKAIRTQRITSLSTKCPYRMILNGTPISRSEADLFAQWYILDWRVLGYRSFYSFAANHIEYDPNVPGKVRRTLNTDYLVEKIAPYSYQISKKDAYDLPRKNYEEAVYYLSDDQSEHYVEIVNESILRMDDMQPETIYRMFAAVQAVISGMYVSGLDTKHFKTSPIFDNPEDNPRIQKLLEIIEDIDPEEKVLIFAKYSHEIEAIVSILGNALPFYGKLNRRQRNANLEAFRGDVRFLVANKICAGYGLNLQFCRFVIYYSNDWDWATRSQSEDRVHRIGQDREVHIIDISAAHTLDKKILCCLSRKERLEEQIKAEIRESNDVNQAKDEFRKWLLGEVKDGKDVRQQDGVSGHAGTA